MEISEEVAPLEVTISPPAPKTAKQTNCQKDSAKELIEHLAVAIHDEYLLNSCCSVSGDIHQKFLRRKKRSLPPSWSQIALIMRNKPDIDQTDIDDLYNNLRVYEDEMKSTAVLNFGVNTAGGTNSSSQVSSTPGADEVVCSFFAQQTTSPPLDNEDLQQIESRLMRMNRNIRWQVAMLTIRVQRFIKKTGRNLDFKGKQLVTFDKSQVECYNCHRKGHFAKECKLGWNQGKRSYGDNGRRNATTNEPSSQALVAQDGLGRIMTGANDLMNQLIMLVDIPPQASSSASNKEVQNCSKQCLESFKTLQRTLIVKEKNIAEQSRNFFPG
ncbi:ribonuclease H-like domain-containing protein [Tanacetum coccineum]